MRRILPALAATAVWACSCSDNTGRDTPRRDISIGTGGTGGVYYPYGGGLAELWSQHVPGVRAVAEVTVPRELFAAILDRIQRFGVPPPLVQRG